METARASSATHAAGAGPTGRGYQRYRVATAVAAWSYLASVALACFLIWTAGDRWWFATILLFGPRWLFGLPLLALIPAGLRWDRRAMFPLVAAMAVWIWPLMGLCMPWRSNTVEEPTLRILTCNVQGGELAGSALADLVVAEQPDIVALQECNAEVNIRWPDSWHEIRCPGQQVIASRYPLSDVSEFVRKHPQSEWAQVDALRCVVSTPAGDVGFCCIHLMSPREGLDQALSRWTIVRPGGIRELRLETEHRRWESEELQAWIAGFQGRTLIAGDFNTPVESAIYRNVWSRLSNAFSSAGCGYGYTKITSKGTIQYGSRIDHILYDNAEFGCRRCRVGPDVGSDHLPLIAEIVVQGG